MRIVKKGRTVENLLRKLKKEAVVEVGHFEDQGLHHSGYTYPELMAFHNKEDGFSNENVPPRPILEITKFRVNGTYKNVFRGMNSVFKAGYSAKAMKEYLFKVGNKIKKLEQEVFGGSTHLQANAPSTITAKGRNEPMVEQGDLRAHVDVRVRNK